MFIRASKKNGFALAEVLVALFFVTMAIALVTGLGQQVMNLAKSSRQTAAVVELRSKSNAMTRNVDSWLAKMRSSADSGAIYSACIPDPSAASSIFACPAVDAALLTNDAELQRIAGTQLHASSVPIVDLMGDKIAGTEDAPLYFDLDGRICTTNNCPIKSVGYMLRSNPDTDANPGSVRFVVKLQPKNTAGSAPLKTQYFTMDVGMEWNQPSGFCPSGTLKVGYLSSGKPNCINPSKKCAAGTIHLGLDSGGDPICKAPPASCASTGGSVVINAAGDDLVCAASTPCGSNEIFLGYYSGTGVPMCSTTNMSCPDGQVQVGISGSTGTLQAQCKTLPSCLESQKLSYDGSQFVCANASVASNCATGEIVVGINEDGSAKCAPQERNLASTELTCPTGKYVSGLEPSGKVICSNLPSGGGAGAIVPTWEAVSLTDTADFDSECEYRAKVKVSGAAINFLESDTSWRNAIAKSNKFLMMSYVKGSGGVDAVQGIRSISRSQMGHRAVDGVFHSYGNIVEAIQKKCEAVSAAVPNTPTNNVVQATLVQCNSGSGSCIGQCPAGTKILGQPYVVSGGPWGGRVSQRDETSFTCSATQNPRFGTMYPSVCAASCSP